MNINGKAFLGLTTAIQTTPRHLLPLWQKKKSSINKFDPTYKSALKLLKKERIVEQVSIDEKKVLKLTKKHFHKQKNYIIKKLFSNSEENITMTGADLMNYGIPTVTPENQHVRHTAALYLVQML